jgi:hypothetical protein
MCGILWTHLQLLHVHIKWVDNISYLIYLNPFDTMATLVLSWHFSCSCKIDSHIHVSNYPTTCFTYDAILFDYEIMWVHVAIDVLYNSNSIMDVVMEDKFDMWLWTKWISMGMFTTIRAKVHSIRGFTITRSIVTNVLKGTIMMRCVSRWMQRKENWQKHYGLVHSDRNAYSSQCSNDTIYEYTQRCAYCDAN